VRDGLSECVFKSVFNLFFINVISDPVSIKQVQYTPLTLRDISGLPTLILSLTGETMAMASLLVAEGISRRICRTGGWEWARPVGCGKGAVS